MQTTAQSIVLGTTTIAVASDQFGNAFQEGYLRFKTQFTGAVLSDEGIYHFIANNIYFLEHQSVENAGYITGWMAGLFENTGGSPGSEAVSSPVFGETV